MSELVVTLRQPAQLGDRTRGDHVLSTYPYIPGTTVRGAFAAAWIAAHGEPSPGSPHRVEFLCLFEGGVRYGPLFSGAVVMPLSVVSHKYQPGQQCGVAEYDRAVDDDVPGRCPDCGSPLEHDKGLRGTAPDVRRRTGVAIASSGVALRGQLFTREALQPGQSFRGNLIASEPGLLKLLTALGPVRVGGRRTTHGAAEVRVEEGAPPPTAERRGDGRLVVRLRSPGIFVDDHGLPSRDPSARELEAVLGCQARVVRRWTRWQTVGGWHIASGLPKPMELAVAAGSTYLIETSRDVSDEELAHLGRRGLGLRRHEGFGDLAPAPALAQGRVARVAESKRRQRLEDSVAPLQGIAVTQRELWQPMLERMVAHAAGDESATQFLRDQAGELDRHAADALSAYLGLGLDEAAIVARELGGS